MINNPLLIEFLDLGYDVQLLSDYSDFLVECSQKDYGSQGTHKHHILPKKMKGSNKRRNIIILSYEDHYDAHRILGDCFDRGTHNNIMNKCAMQYLRYWVEYPELALQNSKECAVKLSTYANNRKGKVPWNKGIPHSGETRQKMIENAPNKFGENNPFFNKTHSDESKEKMRQYRKNKKLTLESIEKRTKTRQTNGKPWFTPEAIDQMVKNNSIAKTIKHVRTGMIFLSMARAGRHFGLKQWKLNKAISLGEFVFVEDDND